MLERSHSALNIPGNSADSNRVVVKYFLGLVARVAETFPVTITVEFDEPNSVVDEPLSPDTSNGSIPKPQLLQERFSFASNCSGFALFAAK